MRLLSTFLFTLFFATAGQAQVNSSVAELADAIGVPEVIEIMRSEGLETAAELSDGFLGGPSRSWTRAADRIYDSGRMQEIVLLGMASALNGRDPEPITAFFRSELGIRIIGLELSAREAFMDEGVEKASSEYVQKLRNDDPARYRLLEDFIETNELIESNVIGALNSNFAFLRGLQSAGSFERDVSEQDILQQVWSQEADIREETTDWLFSYLSLAYQPLTDEELEVYLDFSSTRHGKLLNKALFEGFDKMFVELSRAMGTTLGELSKASEL